MTFPGRPALALSAFFLLCTASGVRAEQTEEFSLGNGLKLLVKPDHRAPVVVSMVWYKVGSSYEPSGITGISHALEHMMFKGTPKYPDGQFSEIVARNGGRENAFTGDDYTSYFQQFEKSRLKLSFELEADRMANLSLKPEDFAKEIQVVKEERRLRTDDQPNALAYEQLYAAAFQNVPYHNPVVGWMPDLENMKIEDVQDWYHRWYAPNNATVVVVGDVDPQEVKKLADQYFGPLKPREIVPPKPRLDPSQQGERRISLRAPAELPYLIMGYKVPTLATATEEWEPYALEVLAGVLDGGSSARLEQRLVRGSEVAASAGTGYSLESLHQELFLLDGTPAPGHTIDELEKAINAEIEKVRNELIGDEELSRVKAQVLAQDTYQLDSGMAQAMRLGVYETVGLGWKRGENYLPSIKAVTAEQVREVARKYLVPDAKTVTVLDPLPIDEETRKRMAASKAAASANLR